MPIASDHLQIVNIGVVIAPSVPCTPRLSQPFPPATELITPEWFYRDVKFCQLG